MVFYAPTVNSYKRYVDALVGADAPRLELRQPHRRLPRRRRRPEPAHRVPHPGRRLQPLPRARRRARLRARRHREQDRAAASASSATSTRRASLPRVPYTLREAIGRVRSERIRQARVRRRRRRALHPLLPHRGSGLRQGGHRLGAAAVLREDHDETQGQSRAHHRRRQRHRPRSRRCSSRAKARRSSRVDVNEQAARETVADPEAGGNAIAVQGRRLEGRATASSMVARGREASSAS